ncbi:MAG: bifunctional phosphoglucose/phosphomannose isomerase [Ignavibacteria bacterium]|nr:bifunctional phosphoglucose/phosphomannose isomerase [Ignavibacteria bacterium]MCC7158153.1 bifunctional phosphoglucose/phosphomannose isomerase [Ignavibacteria bacterium]
MITKAEINAIDSKNMFEVLENFPAQLKHAFDIGSKTEIPSYLKDVSNIIITGLGGSAIGGDLLRSFLQYEIRVPIQVNRNYFLPFYAGKNTLVICSSYSGETEETLSAYNDAKSRGCMIVCVSSGGKLSVIAGSDGNLVVNVPKGYQPRCALAFSFIPMLMLLVKAGIVKERDEEINSLIDLMKLKSASYISFDRNTAIDTAGHISGRIPVIYSSNDLLDIVNLRWRGQLAENAKSLAFGNYFPELNHNEIVGWQENSEILSKFAVLFLKDREDNPRLLKRLEITKEIIRPYRGIDIVIESEGTSKLERIFDLVYLGDWVSYYLAILNKVDPSPIEKINILKNKLMEN